MKTLFILQSFDHLAFGGHSGSSSNPVPAAVVGVVLAGVAFFTIAGLLFPRRFPAMRWGKRGQSHPASKLSQLWWAGMLTLGSVPCLAKVFHWEIGSEGLWTWLIGVFILGLPLAVFDSCKGPVEEKEE